MLNGEQQLPDGWKLKTVGELYEVLGGGTPSTAVPEYWDGDIPWITSADIAGLKDIQPRKHITKDAIANSATNLVPAGSLIVVTRVSLGKVALTNYPLCFSQDSQALIAKNGSVLPEYALYYLAQATQIFKYQGRGTTISGVTKKQLKELPFPLPPIPEQERIVAKIEELFTQLDAGTSALERVQAGLRRYKASVLKAAVSGRLVDGNSELGEGELPEGWQRVTWKEISPRVTVGYVGKMKDEYTESGVPFLRGQNVREMRFDPTGLLHISPRFHKRISKSTLNPGDIVVVRSGSVGVSCVIPETLEEANCSDLVIIKKPQEMIPEFGAYYLNSLAKSYVREKQVGVALTHFNTRSVADMPVPLPPLEEQRRIVAEVERRLSVARQVESAVGEALVRASRLRQAVLKSAFEGRLA